MDAWRARAVDTDLQKEIAAASAKFGSGSGGATKHASSGKSESGRSSDDDAKTPAAKRAKKSAKPAARMPSEIGVTIPCSAVVVGKGLGKVQAPKTKCPTCNLDGHWRVDCPVAWANAGKPLPGFSSRGGRLKGAFTDGNPTKDTFAPVSYTHLTLPTIYSV